MNTKEKYLIEEDDKKVFVYFTTNTELLIGDTENLELLDNRKEELTECPNPDCRYNCHPSWKKCPVCDTKLIINKF